MESISTNSSEIEVDRKSREAAIQECLSALVASNSGDQCIAAFDILHKLISNILKNPAEEKFRMIKKSNKAIQAKLMVLQPAAKLQELLANLGYVETDPDMLAFVGNYFNVLNHGAVQIDDESMKLKMEKMSPEDRKKQELIIQNRKECLAKMRADAEYKRELAELSMKERTAKG